MGSEALVLERGQGRSVSLRGTRVGFKIESDRAQGASCTEWIAAPGFDTGLHVHERLEETWYVLEGELEFRLDEETVHEPPDDEIELVLDPQEEGCQQAFRAVLARAGRSPVW